MKHIFTAGMFCFIAEEASSGPIAQSSSPAELVDALHSAFGDHHSRAVHAKGVVLEGSFTPDRQAKNWTKAAHLQATICPVMVRFSDFTGIPAISDNIAAANPRGFAIKFKLADGSGTDIVCHSFDGFPTATSDEFSCFLLAIGASVPGLDKPTPLDKFLETHPTAKAFLDNQKNPASFASISYFGVNAFQFTNGAGASHFIRYRFVPENGEVLLTNDQFSKSGTGYLFDEIKERITKGRVRFLLYAQIAADSDNIDDPSIAWPASREKVLLGILTLDKLTGNTVDEDKSLAFSPGNLTDGIQTADPMLDFRTRTYPISLHNRQ